MNKTKLLLPTMLGFSTITGVAMPLVSCGEKIDAEHIDKIETFKQGDETLDILVADSQKFTVGETAKFSAKWSDIKKISNFREDGWALILTNSFILGPSSDPNDFCSAQPEGPKLCLDERELILGTDYLCTPAPSCSLMPKGEIWSNVADESIISGEFTIGKLETIGGEQCDSKLQFAILSTH